MASAALTGHEIQLVRRDVTYVGSTSPNCMVLYPPGKKSKQRIGLGNKTGSVSVFSIGKVMDCVPVFDSPPQEKPVSCVALYEDQIFFIRGGILDAYSRKGKHFFSFDTNVTEEIHSLFVSTPYIVTCGSFMVTSFEEARELGFYMAPDRINAMEVFVASSALKRTELTFDDYRCAIGCNDRTIRVLRGDKMVDEIHCESSLSALRVSSTERRLYYGTHAGSIGCLDLKSSDASLTRIFSRIPNDRASAITALALYDINHDTREELLVGRQDGTVEVLAFLEHGGLTCVWSGQADESVLSLAGGHITHTRRPDVLVHSFSGNLIAYTLTEESHASAAEGTLAAATATTTAVTAAVAAEVGETPEAEITEAQLSAIQAEITALQKEIATKSRELAECTGAARTGAPLLAVASTFTAKITLTPQCDSPALLLTVESDTPLHCVALQSDVALRFLDTDAAQVAVQDGLPRSTSTIKTLAVLRPVDGRPYSCAASFWAVDGHWGTLRINTMAAPAPRTAQLRKLTLFPLPLHTRISEAVDGGNKTEEEREKSAKEGTQAEGGEEEKGRDERFYSKMEVTGDFTARDMHSWIVRMLPGTPEIYQPHLPLLRYERAFLHTTMEIHYADGAASFLSDSLPTLAVARRFLTECAVGRSICVGFRMHAHEAALRYGLRCLAPYMAANNRAMHDARLVEALRDLQGDGAERAMLSEEHRKLLARGDEVQRQRMRASETEEYVHRALLALHESAAEFVPGTPGGTVAVREVLHAAMMSGEKAGDVMLALERVLMPGGAAGHIGTEIHT